MNTAHLFAGRGGGLLADLILGHNPILAVEWNHEACENLREKASEGWYPNLHVWEGDVRLFDPSKWQGRVDCIHAGFPCQDLSVAGKQAGLGEGTRSGLYREVLRIAGEIRPRIIFLENVAAIVNNGLNIVLRDLATLGYDARWCVVSASDVGANHQRDRWWCVATKVRHADSFNGEEGYLPETSLVRRTQAQLGRSGSTSGIHQSRDNTDVSNTNNKPVSAESQQPFSVEGHTRHKLARSSTAGIISNTNGTRHNTKEQSSVCTTQKRTGLTNNIADANWWSTESTVCRVDARLSDKLHKDETKARLFGLGNAQVPLAAAVAWTILTKDMEF